MKFEEEFPSLKPRRAITLWNNGDYTFDKEIGRDDDTAFLVKDIRKNCIDKEKLKKAIFETCNEGIDFYNNDKDLIQCVELFKQVLNKKLGIKE